MVGQGRAEQHQRQYCNRNNLSSPQQPCLPDNPASDRDSAKPRRRRIVHLVHKYNIWLVVYLIYQANLA